MKSYRQYLLLLALIVVYPVVLYAQSINTLGSQIKSKIDPILQQAIILKEQSPKRPLKTIESYDAGTRLSTATGDVVAVLIKSTDDIYDYVQSIGGVVGSKHGTIYTALIPIQSVAQLAQQVTVSYIEASRWLYSSLDLSRAKTGADVLHSIADPARRLTGKGIIIGFTDSGINTDHPNFKTSSGKTRILYVWDQYATSGGLPPAGFSYGIEKDSAAINAKTWSMSDGGQHGTHVSGIAAGNGLPSKQYIGMAPEADIIMVANRGDDLWDHGLTTVGTLDGYDYIRRKAQTLGKRFVINTSQGTNLGPHDGTTLFEQAVNADVAAGNIHCLSAGNAAIDARHASAVITTTKPQEIECYISGSSSYIIPMDIWYERNDRLELRMKLSSSSTYTAFFPAVDSTISYSFGSISVTVTTKIGSPLNGDNEIYISFQPVTSGTYQMKLQFSAQPGNTLPDGGRVDLWWERNWPVAFNDHVDQSITLGMPSCADSAITVASYNNRTNYGSVDDISTFSSRGPRRDGVMKPDIAGIGGMVMSSVGSSGYATFSGTSMSSPHVAGAVALLLQQDTSLTNYQVKQKLFNAATADAFTGPVPNPTWGYGKLNVLKAAGYRGIPIISVLKDTIQFKNPFVGITTYDSVLIENLGNEDLTIGSISVSDPIFSVDKSSMVIAPRSQDKVVVGVTPTTTGSFSGILTITCDDTTRPTVNIALLGRGDYAPSIGVSPDSLAFVVNEKDSASAPLTINNSGIGTLFWSVDAAGSGLTSTRMYTLPATSTTISSPDKSTEAATNVTSAVLDGSFADLAGKRIGIFNYTYYYSIIGADLISRGARVYPLISPVYSSVLDTLDVLAIDDAIYSLTATEISAIRTWIQSGHGILVQGDNSSSMININALISGTNITEYSLGNFYDGFFTDIAPHQITADVDTVAGMAYGGYCDATAPALVLVRDDNTRPHIVISTLGSGRVMVACNEIAEDYNLAYYNDMRTLANQSFDWLVGAGAFASIEPTSGTVAPGGSQIARVKVNAKTVDPGLHRAVIALYNNDPLNNPKNVPVSMRVVGKPVIEVAPDTLKYNPAYVGVMNIDTLHIKNIGSDILEISSITVSDAAFDPSKTSVDVPSGGEEQVLIKFTPRSIGTIAATITITSNDSSALTKIVPIMGNIVYPPIITVIPDSFDVRVNEKDSAKYTLAIGNTGAGMLHWTSSCDFISAGFDNPYRDGSNDIVRLATDQSETDQTSREMIVKTGSLSVPIGDFYDGFEDGNFTEWDNNGTTGIREVTNSTAAEGAYSFHYQNTTLGHSHGISRDFIVNYRPEYVGFYIRTGSNSLSGGYFRLDGDASILEVIWFYAKYNGKFYINDDVGGDNTFAYNANQWYHVEFRNIDWVNKNFDYYVDNVLIKADIPFRNAAIANQFGRLYLYNFESTEAWWDGISMGMPSDWMTLMPDSGSVAPGATQNIEVKFDAKDMLPGDYRSVVSITSNDPVNNPKNVPAKMHVIGKPAIEVHPDTVKAGLTYIGTSRVDTVRVRNVGSDVLDITNMYICSLHPVFTFSVPTVVGDCRPIFSVQPGGEKEVFVTFTPIDSIKYVGDLTLTSNDSLHPSVRIILQGRGAYPPVIGVSPDSLSFVVFERDSVSAPITISNSGIGELTYEVKINYEPIISPKTSQLSTSFPREWINKFKSDVSASPATQSIFGVTSPLPLIIQDPIGDATGVDISEVRGMTGIGFLSVQIVTATKLDPMNFAGYLGLDIDQNQTTGMTLPYGLPGQDVGCEFVLSFFNLSYGVEMMDSLGSYVGTFPAVIDIAGNNFMFTIPMSSLNNDEGRMNIAGVLGTSSGPTDYVPDFGHGTIGLSWLSTTPTRGTVAAGSSQIVTVKANGAMVTPGQYHATIILENNDPFHNPKNVPVLMQVIGKPVIAVKPDTVKSGVTYVGMSHVDTMKVKNNGSDLLQVTNIVSSLSVFTTDITNFTVLPGTSQLVMVRFTPTDSIAYNGVLTITSNDSLHPSVDVILQGRGVYPPVIGVSPDSLSFVVNERDSASASLTISNTGKGPLFWSADAAGGGSTSTRMYSLPAISTTVSNPDAPASTAVQVTSSEINNTFADLTGKRIGILGYGSYTIKNDLISRGANVYSMYSPISSSILDTLDVITIDDIIYSMSAGEIAAVRTWVQAGHGVLVQGDDGSSMTNINALIAGTGITEYSWGGFYNGIFTDITPHQITEGVDTVFSYSYGSHCSAEAPAFVLVRDDSVRPHIVISNLGLGRVMVSCNELEAAYNDDRILANRAFDWLVEEGSGFVNVEPRSGTVAPGNSQVVAVNVNAGDMSPGLYRRVLALYNNDPHNNPKNVPMSIRIIGKPAIAVTPDTLRYNPAYVGVVGIDTLCITNKGSAELQVSSITPSDTAFHPSRTSLIVLPGEQEDVLISFMPTSIGAFSATITVSSNDSDALVKTIPVIGEAFYPPTINVSPDSLLASVKKGDSTASMLTISNTGLGELQWEILQGISASLDAGSTSLVSRTEAERAVIEQSQKEAGGNNSGPATISPYPLDALLTTTGTTRVLLWTLYSDNNPGGEVENTMNAIRQYNSDVVFDTTKTTSPAFLASRLTQADIFIVPEQERIGDLSSLGASFSSVLTSFIQSGRTMIVMDFYTTGATTLLNATGLLYINIASTSYQFTAVVHDITSPLVSGVSSTFLALNGSNYHTSTNGSKIIREQSTGNNVVTLRDIGAGRIIYYGMDFYSYNSNMARVLANAVISSASGSYISVFPNSGTIAPGNLQSVKITFNAKYLSQGEYRSKLTVCTNDPLNGSKIVPVILTVTDDGTSVSENDLIIPKVFELYQNYPNPFNPVTTIQYDLPKKVYVTFSIYNILGERINTLVNQEQGAGKYIIVWNGQTKYGSTASGIYFGVIQAGDFKKNVKMLLLK